MIRSLTIEAERTLVDGRIQPATLGLGPDGFHAVAAAGAQLRLDKRYLVLPGLVNAHDHLEFNAFPPLGRRGAYGDMYEWASEIRQQWDSPAIRACLSIPMEDRLRIGGLKNLLSGVTTVVHHNPYHECFGRGFPVRVVRHYTWSHSLGLDPDAEKTFRTTPSDVPWIIHAAEGVTSRATSEIDELERLGMLGRNSVIVHAIGAGEHHFELLTRRGVSIVSCPVSNLFLYGQSLDYGKLPPKLRVALGSDSVVSSSQGLLEDIRELRRLTGWDESRLWRAVTSVPSDIFRLPQPGRDLVVLENDEPVLVVRDGKALFGEDSYRDLFDVATRRLVVAGRQMLLSRRVALPEQSIHRAAEWTPFLRDVRLRDG